MGSYVRMNKVADVLEVMGLPSHFTWVDSDQEDTQGQDFNSVINPLITEMRFDKISNHI